MEKIKKSEIGDLKKRLIFWEETAKKHAEEADYYQLELEKAHALLGRVIHQLSERWDQVNLTKYFPTDNLSHNRSITNPKGKN